MLGGAPAESEGGNYPKRIQVLKSPSRLSPLSGVSSLTTSATLNMAPQLSLPVCHSEAAGATSQRGGGPGSHCYR